MEIEKPKMWDQVMKVYQKLQGVVYVECILCHGVYPKHECKFSLDEKENVNAICGRCERENRVISSQEIEIKVNKEVLDEMCEQYEKELNEEMANREARKMKEIKEQQQRDQERMEAMCRADSTCERPQQAGQQAHYEALARQLEDKSARIQLKVHRFQEALLGPEPRGKGGEDRENVTLSHILEDALKNMHQTEELLETLLVEVKQRLGDLHL